MSNSSIWPIDKTLSGATTPGQSGPGSDGNEGALHIPQSSSITGASSSDCLVSYTGHSFRGPTSLQRCSQCILQPWPTGRLKSWSINIYIYNEGSIHLFIQRIGHLDENTRYFFKILMSFQPFRIFDDF